MANLAAVGIKVPQHPEWRMHTELPLLVMQGFAESMAPGILGFSLLSVTALACALGLWRHNLLAKRSPHAALVQSDA